MTEGALLEIFFFVIPKLIYKHTEDRGHLMECSLSITAWLTKQFLNDFRKMSREGAGPLCET